MGHFQPTHSHANSPSVSFKAKPSKGSLGTALVRSSTGTNHAYTCLYITQAATLPNRGTETEFFPTWKHEIDENQTNLPVI